MSIEGTKKHLASMRALVAVSGLSAEGRRDWLRGLRAIETALDATERRIEVASELLDRASRANASALVMLVASALFCILAWAGVIADFIGLAQ